MDKTINNIFKALSIFVVGVLIALTFTACGNKVTQIQIKEGTIATTIYQNEELDLSNLVLIVTYQDKTTKEISKNDEMEISTIDTTTIGTKTLTIKYMGAETSLSINVQAPKGEPTTIEVKEGTLLNTVDLNGEIDFSKLVLIVTYENGTTEEVAKNNEMKFSTIDTTTEGEKILTISYLGCQVEFTINVVVNKGQPVSLELKEGTLKTTIKQNEQLDLSNLTLKVNYSLNGYFDYVLKNDDMQISTIDTSIVGSQILTIKYLGLTLEIEINIEPEYDVIGFGKPQNLVNFENVSSISEGEDAYSITKQKYVIGDDNEFVINPIITVLDENYEPNNNILNYIDCDYKVEIYNESAGNYNVLDNYSDYLNIANDKFALKFTNQAVDKIFKITITPSEYNGIGSFYFEAKIVDGFNVHNSKELSVLDNNSLTINIWKEFKEKYNIPQNITPNKVILHNNMILTEEDLPKAYLYNAGDTDNSSALQGHLRDRKSIYTVDTSFGKNFELYGNYFTIDASGLPLVPIKELRRLDPSYPVFGHSALISFGRDNNYSPSTKQGNNIVNTVKFIGNGNRSEDENLFGGIYMIQNSSNELIVKNVIARSFQTNINTMYNRNNDGTSDWENTTRIEKTKMYDSFSIMLGSYGTKNNYIIDSVLKNSGGPTLLMTHVNPHDNPDSFYSTVTIENSVVETSATGGESWFTGNGANSIVSKILAMDALIKGTSQVLKNAGQLDNAKTFVPNNKANLMVLFAANDPLANPYPIKGQMTVKDSEGNVIMSHNMADENYKAIMDVIGEMGKALPFFQSCDGTLVTITTDGNQQPTGLGKVTQNGYGPLIPESATLEDYNYAKSFFKGDYLNLFYAGGALGAVLGYYNA